MASAILVSTQVQNAVLDSIEQAIGQTPSFKIWSGTIPSTLASSETGVTLASMVLPADWMANAAGGSKSMLGTWEDQSADADGWAGYFRLYDTAGVCHMQGWVGQTWAAGMALSVNQQVISGGNVYRCTAAGNTGASGPTFTSGSAQDGTATLAYLGLAAMTLDNDKFSLGQDIKITAFTLLYGA